MGFAEEALHSDEQKAREITDEYFNGDISSVDFFRGQLSRTDTIPFLKGMGDAALGGVKDRLVEAGFTERDANVWLSGFHAARVIVLNIIDSEVPDTMPLD